MTKVQVRKVDKKKKKKLECGTGCTSWVCNNWTAGLTAVLDVLLLDSSLREGSELFDSSYLAVPWDLELPVLTGGGGGWTRRGRTGRGSAWRAIICGQGTLLLSARADDEVWPKERRRRSASVPEAGSRIMLSFGSEVLLPKGGFF